MTEKQIFDVIDSVKVLSLSPSDYLVVKSNKRLWNEQVIQLKESLQRMFPEQKIMILDGGLDIEVVRKAA
jgi:hypothetical protein